MRLAFALVCALAFAALNAPAKAADYSYRGGYYYSSNGCCAEKAVRYDHRPVRSLLGTYSPYGYGPRVYLYPEEPSRVVRFSEHDFYTSIGDYAQARCHWQQLPLRAGKSFWVWGVKTDCW